jgi:hypothetical protein
VSCDGGGGEEVDVLSLDSPWVSAAEAESILEEAAVAAGLFPGAGKDAEADEIQANQERQQDEVRLALLTYLLIKLEKLANPMTSISSVKLNRDGVHMLVALLTHLLSGAVWIKRISRKFSVLDTVNSAACSDIQFRRNNLLRK